MIQKTQRGPRQKGCHIPALIEALGLKPFAHPDTLSGFIAQVSLGVFLRLKEAVVQGACSVRPQDWLSPLSFRVPDSATD